MRIARFFLGLIVAAFAAIGVVFVVGMRRKSPIVLNTVRRSGRAMKPLVLRTAGTAGSPTAVVHHVGRQSGLEYRTPVVATPIEGGFGVALPYGPNTDWLKNVLHAGRATIVVDGESHDVVDPRVVGIDEIATHFSRGDQRMHELFAVHEGLVVRSVPSTSAERTDDVLVDNV
jgi:deazaflavin-dependent oxidoreductase (nitroreductase family)